MAQRADIYVAITGGVLQFNGAGTQYLVQTPTGVLYLVYVDNASDVVYKKSTDNGITWTQQVTVFTGTIVALSVWYDRWSNISAGLIHMAYTESGNSDTLYRTIDTESSDALSTETTIFAGTSTATGGHLSIARSRGGNVYCKTCIDAGAEGGFFKLLNANVPNGAWEAALTIDEALATTDQMILLPGFAADNNDMLAIFWDGSANEISRKVYDDSGNSWAETSIVAATDGVATTAFPHFAAAVDLTNSQIILIAWNAIDAANADLLCWTVTESAVTAKTDVVTNSTDDQALAAVGIDTGTGYWYAFYAGKTDGSETVYTLLNVYYKVSQDSGATWGPETAITSTTRPVKWMACTQRFTRPFALAFHVDETFREIRVSAQITQARARSQVGL